MGQIAHCGALFGQLHPKAGNKFLKLDVCLRLDESALVGNPDAFPLAT